MVAATDIPPLRVLVVDDNPLIRESVVVTIQRMNSRLPEGARKLQVLEAEDGATAWDRITDRAVDLVIADLYIPVLSGLRLIERIRANPATAALRILAISASIEDARMASLGAGADLFLQKPIRLVELADAVSRLLKLETL